MRRDVSSGLHISGVPDNQRVIATHLQGQDDFRTPSEVLVEEDACIRRSCEQQAIDVCVEQGATCLPAPMHDIQHACWQACCGKCFRHERCHPRRQFRRFEDTRVASQQRWHDMPVRQVAGKVERPIDRHDSMCAVRQMHGAEGGLLRLSASTFHLRRNRDGDLGFHRGGFAPGLPKRLAHIPANHFSYCVCALADFIRIRLENGGALTLRRARPVMKGAPRALDGGCYIARIRGCALPYHVARGRTVVLEFRSIAAAPLPVDPDGIAHFQLLTQIRVFAPGLIRSFSNTSAVVTTVSSPCSASIAWLTRKSGSWSVETRP